MSKMAPRGKRVYCICEDRESEEVGVRLAVVSLLQACPSARVVVYRPNPSNSFRRWLAGQARAKLVSDLPPGASSWNCKPHTLLPLLEGDSDEAIWLDSDIIVTRNPSYLFDRLGPDELVGTQEPPSSTHQGLAIRTAAWGLALGRDFPITLNSCVVRVTRAHLPLLKRWQQLLGDPTYLAVQALPVHERPIHMMGDQDVLNALLGSKEFAQVPVRYLRGGRDVIHCGGALGYSLAQRLSGLLEPVPPFLHAIAGKPWWVFHPNYQRIHTRWFTFYRRLLQETSPYVAAARPLRAKVGAPCPWLDVHSMLGGSLCLAGFGHFALSGLPLSAIATAAMKVRKLFPSP